MGKLFQNFELLKKNLEVTDKAQGEEAGVLAYYLNIFTLAGFPYSRYEGQEFSREVKGLHTAFGVANYGKTIKYRLEKRKAQRTLEIPIEIPHGAEARVILVYLIYRIKRFKEKHIQLPSSFARFLEDLRVKVSYNEGESFENYLTALIGLCNSYIVINDVREKDNSTMLNGDNSMLVDSYSLWWSEDFEEGNAFIRVSDKFYNSVQAKASPVKWNDVVKINKNPFRMDLYFWLVSKSFSIKTETATYSWAEVFATFGLDYTDFNEFKKKFRYEIKGLEKSIPKCQGLLKCDSKGVVHFNNGPIIPASIQEGIAQDSINALKKSFE